MGLRGLDLKEQFVQNITKRSEAGGSYNLAAAAASQQEFTWGAQFCVNKHKGREPKTEAEG